MPGPPTFTDVLVDLAGRIRDATAAAAAGLDGDALAWRPAAGANPIGWLAWHTARIQDDHIADLAGATQVYADGGWAARLGLPADTDIGYGHDDADVDAHCPTDAEVLLAYLDAVTAVTTRFLADLDADVLGRIVDERWDPPVTMAVRLASILTDNLQHAGQAAYVRGVWDSR